MVSGRDFCVAAVPAWSELRAQLSPYAAERACSGKQGLLAIVVCCLCVDGGRGCIVACGRGELPRGVTVDCASRSELVD